MTKSIIAEIVKVENMINYVLNFKFLKQIIMLFIVNASIRYLKNNFYLK